MVTGTNDNSIFFPAAGIRSRSSLYYDGNFGNCWSSTPYDDYGGYDAGSLNFSYGFESVDWINGRYKGLTVRPITE